MSATSPWQPQPGPQAAAIDARHLCGELFFGGARGGGKSDFLLGDFLQDIPQGASWRGILFRRSHPELEELLHRAGQIYTTLGAEWHQTRRVWLFPGGATLKLRHLDRVSDAARYQGHQFTWIGFDELTNWPSDEAYRQLKACLRAAAGVHGRRMRATGNPGGPGHGWVKQRFIDPAPGGYPPLSDHPGGPTRMFIPSRVTDNRHLLTHDPEYVARLREVGAPALVRAWLEGDWNAAVGAYFPEFSGTLHVTPPAPVPAHWTRLRAFDWGSARPFAVLWLAVADGSRGGWPAGTLWVYREWYGASGPNQGLKMTAEEVAREITRREQGETLQDAVADPALFAEDGGPSLAERMRLGGGVHFRPADNQRMAGWDQVRARLKGIDGVPTLRISSTCVHLIRTLPALQHDRSRPEDVDSSGEDHAADALRYACMSRPLPRRQPAHAPLRDRWSGLFDTKESASWKTS
ncbi:MAG: terminase family protein [Magnetococcus sp. WYHC-3]